MSPRTVLLCFNFLGGLLREQQKLAAAFFRIAQAPEDQLIGGLSMEDREIVNLYWERNSNAIKETASKYGGYCKAIAKNILGNNEDAEECVNDIYLNTWNSIPPNRPNVLSTYLGKITRNLSFDRFRHRHADKRGGGEIELVLDELGECVSGADSVEQEVGKKELIRAINSFLDTLSQEKCNIFLCRYWCAN